VHSLPIPETVPKSDRLIFFPGSSLGNFEPQEALAFLKMCHETAGRNGMMLIGVDTKKDHAILNAAYNDAAGVTAAFNRNLLHRISRELDADCRLDRFDHHAFYNAEAGRVEMHLVSTCEQQLRVDGHSFKFEEGESLHTESSYKYEPDEFVAIAQQAGFDILRRWLDGDRLYAVYLFTTSSGCNKIA
jgi:dimethylhistidine N-methyltransferase